MLTHRARSRAHASASAPANTGASANTSTRANTSASANTSTRANTGAHASAGPRTRTHARAAYFESKTVWIIGASSGIGAELARQLSSYAGIQLLLSARSVDRLEDVASYCRANGATCNVFPLALDSQIDGAAVYRQAREYFSCIDCVLFVAGASQRARFADTRFAVLESIVRANLLSHMAIAHAVAREIALSAENSDGDPVRSKSIHNKKIDHTASSMIKQLVFIGSLAGYVSTPLRSAYSAAKAALHSLAESFVLEMSAHRAKIQLVVPGFVQTDISRNALRADGTQWQTMDTNQKHGMAVEVCARKIIRFLASRSFEKKIGFGMRGTVSFWLRKLCPALLRRLISRARTL